MLVGLFICRATQDDLFNTIIFAKDLEPRYSKFVVICTKFEAFFKIFVES